MLNIKEYLHRIDIFKDRDESTLDFLALSAGVRSYIKNEHIFIDREEVGNFYFVIRGKAALYKLNSRHEKKVIFIYGSGAFLNEVMIQDKFASINCELLTDSSILIIPKSIMLLAMSRDFDLSKAVMDSMALKIRRLYHQMKKHV